MKPAQLGSYLSTLPADMVDKVEVIHKHIDAMVSAIRGGRS